jgi:hypothetical protein
MGAILGGLYNLFAGSFESLLGMIKVLLFGAIGGVALFVAVWLAGALVVRLVAGNKPRADE